MRDPEVDSAVGRLRIYKRHGNSAGMAEAKGDLAVAKALRELRASGAPLTAAQRARVVGAVVPGAADIL